MAALKNIRHEKSVQAYLSNGGNKSAAYREVFKGSLKWKEKTVWERSSRLFSEYKVNARVKELQKQLADKHIISKEEIINDLKVISSVSIEDYVESFDKKTGNIIFKEPKDWTHAMKRACNGIKPTAHGIELTVYGVQYAYARIAKMMGYDAPTKIIQADTTLGDLLKKE